MLCLDKGLEPVGIGEVSARAAIEDQGLDLLGPHHRTHACPTGRAPLVVFDDCKADQVFTGRSDDDGAGFVRAA